MPGGVDPRASEERTRNCCSNRDDGTTVQRGSRSPVIPPSTVSAVPVVEPDSGEPR